MKALIILASLQFSFSSQAFEVSEATYYVPVKKELSDFANFPITNLNIEENEISYSLPQDLIGFNFPKMSFYKVDENKYESAYGSLNCAIIDETQNCAVEYSKDYQRTLEVLSPVILKQFEKNIKDQKLSHARSEVFKVFSGDPLGILSFKISN